MSNLGIITVSILSLLCAKYYFGNDYLFIISFSVFSSIIFIMILTFILGAYTLIKLNLKN